VPTGESPGIDRHGAAGGVGYAARVRLAVASLLLFVAGCSVEFLSTTPSNPGVPTAPAEVIALAGPDLVVLEGSRVVLAGGASRALLGDPELAWSQREGPLVTLSNPSSPSPTFVAPLGPARLVFSLEAAADDLRDLDEVVVQVVPGPDDLSLPTVVALPADRVAALDEVVRFESPWTGAGAPLVSVRCPTLSPEPLGRLEGGTLVIEVAPRALPCPVVVEDVRDDVEGDAGPVAGRAVVILWPEGTTTTAATRARAPGAVDPGADVTIDLDAGAQAFVVDGTPLALEAGDRTVRFTAPPRPGRLTLVAETRQGPAGGGTRVIAIEVGAGDGNTAPVVDGGPDLRVRPGARFRIAPQASDDDGDATVVDIRQVLGLPAARADGGVDVLVAPDSTTIETLLFHVVAWDGVAESAPEPVRVVVDPAAENLPPLLSLAPELYVTPGSTFVIDGTSARDPDAGLVVSWRIAQSVDDAVQLLPTPAETPSVALVAGAAGERYRFLVSVVDDGGLEASAGIEVIVEEAGPFVDPLRGADDADGTPARPFRAVSEALVTAARHRFPALRLVESAAPIAVPILPDGLGLDGGWRFDDVADDYVAAGGRTAVVLDDDLPGFGGVRIASVEVVGGPPRLRLQRRVDLADVVIADDILLDVADDARVVCDGGDVHDVEVAGTVEFVATAVRGGLRVTGGVVDLRAGSRVGGLERDVAVDLVGGTLRGEAAAEIDGAVVGLRIGPGAVAVIAGTVAVAGDAAVAVEVAGGTLQLDGAVLGATGAGATGILVRSGTVGGATDLSVSGGDVGGVVASAPLGAVLSGHLRVVGDVAAVGVRGPDVALERLRLEVEAPTATGVDAGVATLRSTLIDVDGIDAGGVVADRGELRHVTVRATGVAFTARVDVRIDNSLGLAPVVFGGEGAVPGIVGVVEGTDAGACATCVIGKAAAVGDDGALVADDVLGAPNPFVDVGDPLLALAEDLDGLPIPQGPAPDLGARERPVAAPPAP
jgi:hypothetical protein